MKRYQITLVSLLLSACVDNGYKPIALDNHFGHSVKQISQAQLLNPQAAANPSKKAFKPLDGQLGQSIMNSYRQNAGQAEKPQSVTINAGTAQ